MDYSKKRVISLIVSLLMVLSLIGVLPMKNGVNATSGEVNPTINSVSISSSTIQKGDNAKLKVTMDVNNIPTGVTNVFIKATPLFGKKVGYVYLISEPFETPEYGSTVEAYIPIDPTVLSGDYQIYSIEIGDASNHTSTYRAHMYGLGGSLPTEEGTVTDNNTFVSSHLFDSNNSDYKFSVPKFTVTGVDIPVYEPELTSINMNAASVNAPGTIQVELGVSDSDPYINGYRVDYFYLNDKVDSGLSAIPKEGLDIAPQNGKYVVDLDLSEYAHPGIYQISRVILYDSLGNETIYEMDYVSRTDKESVDLTTGTYFDSTGLYVPGKLNYLNESFIAPKFEVTGGTEGEVYPELESVSLASSTVNRPGVAKVQLKVKDDVGVNEAYIQFTPLQGYGIGYDAFSGYVNGIDVKDGIISIDIPIDETKYLGKYQPQSLYITNKRGISSTYNIEGIWSNVDRADYESTYSGTYDETSRIFITDTLKNADTIIKVPAFSLTDIDNYYFRASIQNPSLIDLIDETPEGETIGVRLDSKSNNLLSKDVFDAIKGRDIHLIAYKDSYQWVFYGKDIINSTYTVDLSLSVEQVDKSVYGITEDAVKVSFYPNGTLPGKATIRLKSDYLYLKGIKGNLYLYYNNNGSLQLQDNPAFDLELDGSDKWCSFDITHNSEYLITGTKISAEELPLRLETGTGSGNASGSGSGTDNTKTKYSNEWVDGKWYNADGTQTYEGKLEWKCNSSGWWVEDTSGWYPVSSWQKIDGKWYFFLDSGYMDYSEYRDGCWLGSDGAWIEEYYGGHWCSNSTGWWYEDSSGWYPNSQWVWIDGSCYYFKSDGYLATSQYVDGYWVNSSGAQE